MAGVNKAIILGNLGADPEKKSFQNGGQVVNLRIATSETWKDKSTGERKERTEWHSVSILNDALCDVAMKYLRKGSKLYIEGRLETRKWTDSSGAEKYTTEIVLRPYSGEIKLLDSRKDGSPPPNENLDPFAPSGGTSTGGSNSTGRAGHSADEFEDEIPF